MTIYIGYDSREHIAYQVSKFSIEKYTNRQIVPLIQSELRYNNFYYRNHDTLASTEFSFTRFLVPFLNSYTGWALFVDCDTLFLDSPENLFALADDRYAVMCVKHDYQPSAATKMDGCIQHQYPRKNWSSVVLFNCSHHSNSKLTKQLVNTETGLYLHRFSWLKDDEIGELPIAWNWLTNWYVEPNDGTPKLLHYTEGGPWFPNYSNCKYSDRWLETKKLWAFSKESRLAAP